MLFVGREINFKPSNKTCHVLSPFVYFLPGIEIHFCGIFQRQCHYEFITKSCILFCAKWKEVNPDEPSFSMTNKCFDSTQIYNLQWSIKMNWIRASIIGIHRGRTNSKSLELVVQPHFIVYEIKYVQTNRNTFLMENIYITAMAF